MDPQTAEYVNLFLRWAHVFLAILWIGATAHFSWLDSRLTVEVDKATGKEVIWMVHSGGFYVVEKQKKPQLMPRTLHWFKYEALFTWVTGFLLLGVVFYHGGNLVPYEGGAISHGQGVMLGLAILIGGFAVYEGIWSSPLGKVEPLAAAICIAALAGLAWFLPGGADRPAYFTPRATWIHIGALMGTIMAANVWMRIIPAQRQMIDATRRGAEPDMTLGVRAKNRSRHNTFMGIPLVLIMISNHYAVATYGNRWQWAMLLAYIAIGFVARKLLNMHNSAPAKLESSAGT